MSDKKLYVHAVKYVDGKGVSKSALVSTSNPLEPIFSILQAAMKEYGDSFAQEYEIKQIV